MVCFLSSGRDRPVTEVSDMEQPTALSTKAPDGLRPADVRDRLRAAVEANAAELAARRRWATIYRNGRRPATPADARLRARTLREALATTDAA
jgi:hypothetical protein